MTVSGFRGSDRDNHSRAAEPRTDRVTTMQDGVVQVRIIGSLAVTGDLASPVPSGRASRLLAMLAAPGTSYLRNVYVIHRGYEDLAERLNALGASVQPFRDIG